MKRILKHILLVALSVLSMLTLVSCSGGVKSSEAKTTIREFFAAVSAADYDQAESLLHPDVDADLEAFFLGIEQTRGVDFQAGIVIEKYTGFYSTFYDTKIGGSAFELTMRTKVGEKTLTFTIKVVRNDNGYGIYYLNLDA